MSPVLNQPSLDALGGGVGPVQVALDDDRPAHAELPDGVRPGGEVGAVVVDELGVERRHHRPARRRLGEEVAGAVGRHDAVRLGQPVAGRRRRRRPATGRSSRRGRAAAGAPPPPIAEQRRRVPPRPVRVGQQLAAHRRHAGEVGDLLTLDQLQRPARGSTCTSARCARPVSVAGCSRQLHAVTWNSGVGAMNTGCSGGAGDRRRRRDVAGGDRLGVGRRRGHRPEHQVHDVVHRAPVGQLGALGEPGRARRVEDRGVVVGVDGRRRGARRGRPRAG